MKRCAPVVPMRTIQVHPVKLTKPFSAMRVWVLDNPVTSSNPIDTSQRDAASCDVRGAEVGLCV